MRSKPGKPALLLIAFVTAVALCSAGTATAGGLTKTAVKKIAGKVAGKAIKKKAPTLSVAHAGTADTATTATTATSAQTLAGQPASAFQTSAYRYTLTAPVGTTTFVVSFPGLPAGHYQATYSLATGYTATNGAQDVNCAFFFPSDPSTTLLGLTLNSLQEGLATVSASTSLTTSTTQTASLGCAINGATFAAPSIALSLESAVTFTRVDSLTAGSVQTTQARPAAAGSGLAGAR